MTTEQIQTLIVYWRRRCQNARIASRQLKKGSAERLRLMTWASAYATHAGMLDDFINDPALCARFCATVVAQPTESSEANPPGGERVGS